MLRLTTEYNYKLTARGRRCSAKKRVAHNLNHIVSESFG